MGVIQEVSCIKFDQVTDSNPQEHYISITQDGSGCQTSVGFTGEAGQYMNLDSVCMQHGILIHELLHALGFFHQQNSPNRAPYVDIVEENMQDGPGVKEQFQTITDEDWTDLGFEYDYYSIMHYRATAFSKNGKPTIVTKKAGGERIGQRDGLSGTDIDKINKMYNCS